MTIQPAQIANGDDGRMALTRFSEDPHQRISGSELVIYPGAGHRSISPFHEQFTSSAIEFLDRPPLNKNPTPGGRGPNHVSLLPRGSHSTA